MLPWKRICKERPGRLLQVRQEVARDGMAELLPHIPLPAVDWRAELLGTMQKPARFAVPESRCWPVGVGSRANAVSRAPAKPVSTRIRMVDSQSRREVAESRAYRLA